MLLAAHPDLIMDFGLRVVQLDEGKKRPRLKFAQRTRQLYTRFVNEGNLKFLETHGNDSNLPKVLDPSGGCVCRRERPHKKVNHAPVIFPARYLVNVAMHSVGDNSQFLRLARRAEQTLRLR